MFQKIFIESCRTRSGPNVFLISAPERWGGQDVVPRKHPSGCHERGKRGNLALVRGFRERNAQFSAAARWLRRVRGRGFCASMAPCRTYPDEFTEEFVEPRVPTFAAKPPCRSGRVHEIEHDRYRLTVVG
jgi:hypothetical protein